jgi:hypothetical protein
VVIRELQGTEVNTNLLGFRVSLSELFDCVIGAIILHRPSAQRPHHRGRRVRHESFLQLIRRFCPVAQRNPSQMAQVLAPACTSFALIIEMLPFESIEVHLLDSL